MQEQEKRKYMERAIYLAGLGAGATNPNPLVGCVIVKDGKIIGEGYHEKYGGPHAEVNAFNRATEDVEGATLFVTLEPCAHYGKTPPCALKIIEKKIKKVIVAKTDPNPLVNMKGIQMLREAGIEVEIGLLKEEVERQNEVFLKYITTKKPFVALKYAMTLDGKIATRTKDSKWITNEKSRHYVHELRHNYMAILVGVGTVDMDDPHLDSRIEGGRNPIRIILDPNLRTPKDAYVVRTAKEQPTWIVTTRHDAYYEQQGVRLMVMDEINIDKLLRQLGEEKVDSILVEGGAYTHAKFIEAGLVDKVYAFIAPKIVGGKEAPSPVSGEGFAKLSEALKLDNIRFYTFGEDILIEGNVKEKKDD